MNISNETFNVVLDYPSIGYMAAYYGIYYSILFAFCILVSILFCCSSLCICGKKFNFESSEQMFEITRYDMLNFIDKKLLETNISFKNKKDKQHKKRKWCCKRKSVKESSDLLNEIDDDLIKVEEAVNNSTVYLHYNFDNLKTDLRSGKGDPFHELDTFISLVLRSCEPSKTHILFEISSPGGIAYKFESLYSKMLDLREAGFILTAIVNDICASGGYMLACACNEIISSDYAMIGSVGVAMSLHNYHKLIDKIGVIEKTLTTGPYKRPFLAGENYSEENLDIVKEEMNETFSVFSNIVKTARGLTDEELEIITNAKVWYGKDAIKNKLVDRIESTNLYIKNIAKNNLVLVIKPKKSSLGLNNFKSYLVDYAIPDIGTKIISSLISNNRINNNNSYLNIMT
jgi:serine protease SohB